MDFLNKSFAQLKDLFLSMTPGARITSGLLLAVVVVSLGYLFTHEVSGPEVYLLRGKMFSDSDLDRMRMAFGQEGLDSYNIEGNKVQVPHSQLNEYMAALAKHQAMPEDLAEILTRALDSGGAYASSAESEARLKIASETQLSRWISAIPEIETAAVTFDVETKRGLKQEKVGTALAIVKAEGGQPLDRRLASSIRLAVAKAVLGLEPKDVAVQDWNTGQTTLGDEKGFGDPYQNPFFAQQRAREEELKKKILDALNWIPSKTVATRVELDPVQDYQTAERKHDPKTVVGYSQESTVTRTVEPTTPAGNVGYSAQENTARSLTIAANAGPREEEEETQSSQQNVVSTVETTSRRADFPVTLAEAVVTVPTSYFELVWRRKNPPAEGEEAKAPEPSDLEPVRTEVVATIKQTVAAILPKPEGVTDATELVAVAEFPDIIPPPLPEPGMGEKALAWLGQSWSTLGIAGLAFFSLIMLRSMVRGAPLPQIEAGATVRTAPPSGEEEEEAETSGQPTARKLKRFTGSGASLRDELSELVGEDPDTAANILRNWIGNVT
jgi:flagellar M-ring protein FliF